MDIESSESEPFSDSGSDWNPSSSGASLSSLSSVASSVASTSATVDENIDENFTITNGYELKNVPKKSTHKVWEHFGILYKTNRIVSHTKDRIFCRKCFINNTIKRLVSCESHGVTNCLIIIQQSNLLSNPMSFS